VIGGTREGIAEIFQGRTPGESAARQVAKVTPSPRRRMKALKRAQLDFPLAPAPDKASEERYRNPLSFRQPEWRLGIGKTARMRLRITASRPAIVRFSPDSMASPSVSKVRSSGMLILAQVASKNLRNRCSVAHALFRLFRLASEMLHPFSGVCLTGQSHWNVRSIACFDE